MPTRGRSNAVYVKADDEMANAREGVTYFWSKLESPKEVWGISGVVKSAAPGTSAGFYGIKYGTDDMDRTLEESGEQTAQELHGVVKDMITMIGEKLDFHIPLEWFNWILSKTVKSLAPFLSSIVNGIRGLKKLVYALSNEYTLWQVGSVELLPGHPQAIARGIKTLVHFAALDGLYITIRSAVLITLKTVTVGATSVIDGVVGIIDTVIRCIATIKESEALEEFIDECKEFWRMPKGARTMTLAGDGGGFCEMFCKYTKKAPVIAAITLRTGIAGDKMRLMKIYSDDGSAIDDSQFQAGVAYLDALKSIGKDYVQNWGKHLRSSDVLVSGLIQSVVKGNFALSAPPTRWQRFKSTFS